MTHELTRTILTTVEHGAPVAAAVIGMVGAFVPGMTGQVLASSVGLLGLLAVAAQAGLARIGDREAVARSIERGPPEARSSFAEQAAADVEHGPPAEAIGPPADATGPPAEPTPPGAEPGGPELGL